MNWKQRAQRTLELESQAIAQLVARLDDAFEAVGERILQLQGRVVMTGIGKSAIIAQKLVATFNSTGTPAVFMHAADAIHGDLGLVQKDDMVICISKSGNSPEIKALSPLIKSRGIQLIGMVGNLDSHLAQQSDYILDTTVSEEACPLDLAPTSSTAAQMALGDALATCLMEARGFKAEDFAEMHPGGALGKRLYTRLNDLLDAQRKPQVTPTSSLSEVVLQMSQGRCGATAVIDQEQVVGIITDGDLRRHLETAQSATTTAQDLMSSAAKTLEGSHLAVHAFQIMEEHAISQIIVTHEGAYTGMVHLHDLIKEGII
jgi:arabinose-5-phosphate isomerase